ncbi:hypothetical protein GCM10027446_06190 [Angustibacter peucedani]
MASFTVSRELAAPAERAWAVLTDWPNHGRWVALTTVRTTSARPDGVGAQFVGRTALGPLGFDDPMTVTEWQPPTATQPGRCTVRKSGRVVLGSATFVVRSLGPSRCQVSWTEDLEVAGVRRLPFAGAASRLAGRVVFGAVLRKVARDVEQGSP